MLPVFLPTSNYEGQYVLFKTVVSIAPLQLEHSSEALFKIQESKILSDLMKRSNQVMLFEQ